MNAESTHGAMSKYIKLIVVEFHYVKQSARYLEIQGNVFKYKITYKVLKTFSGSTCLQGFHGYEPITFNNNNNNNNHDYYNCRNP